jgi:predicted CXXCH cytochrome family protein
MRNWLIFTVILAAAALVALSSGRHAEVAAPSPPATSVAIAPPEVAPTRAREGFVGSAACASCHRAQSDVYAGSHHAQALVALTPEAAKVRFDGVRFTSKLGGTTKLELKDGSAFVTTPVAGGKTATYPIRYISGVWPLEQYVVETERGKLQSLGVVLDTRDTTKGYDKWLHVYGHEGIAPNDSLFFTSPAQSWNHVCADCHSTWVERRYDEKADSFDSRWAESSVGCEACHGPGAEHVRSGGKSRLSTRLNKAEPWRPSSTGSPAPRAVDDHELEVCAPCHSRRTPVKEHFLAGDPFLDAFEPDLLRPARYHADGQVEGEVYEWGSFLQSRMHAAGVKCSDCHDPHSAKPYASGNALCVRCHESSRFDVPAHSHHEGSRAPRCIDCHMPPQTFMQIDERRDHSIRIPRPDQSVSLGTPNACNGCHAEKSAAWARDALASWAPNAASQAHFAEALAKDRQGAFDAARSLRELAGDAKFPAIARATALERLGSYPGERNRQALATALGSSDPLITYGAVRGAAQLPPPERLALLSAFLDHPLRVVRIATAKALAGAPPTSLSASARAALERDFAEVEQAFAVSASRPETHVEQSAFELARGRLAQAEASLRLALRLEPCLAEAHLNLADLERQRGNETAAERAIRAALECNPQYAAAHHALGLLQIRAKKPQLALASLEKAAQLAPGDARFGYVLAVAHANSGRLADAIRTLEKAVARRPNDATALRALAGYVQQSGDRAQAARLSKRLEVLAQQ